MEYWKANREREARWQYQLITGIPYGLLFALPVIAIIFTARFWYQRADMMVNVGVNPTVMILAVLGIALFIAIFYKRYQWDRKEQQYRYLTAREEAAGKESCP